MILTEDQEKETDLLIPLTNEEKDDQYEAKLKMHPFIPKSQQTATSTTKKKPIANKEEYTTSESTEEDMDVLLKGIVELNFEHT